MYSLINNSSLFWSESYAFLEATNEMSCLNESLKPNSYWKKYGKIISSYEANNEEYMALNSSFFSIEILHLLYPSEYFVKKESFITNIKIESIQ